jgi:hypothetical protein
MPIAIYMMEQPIPILEYSPLLEHRVVSNYLRMWHCSHFCCKCSCLQSQGGLFEGGGDDNDDTLFQLIAHEIYGCRSLIYIGHCSLNVNLSF